PTTVVPVGTLVVVVVGAMHLQSAVQVKPASQPFVPSHCSPPSVSMRPSPQPVPSCAEKDDFLTFFALNDPVSVVQLLTIVAVSTTFLNDPHVPHFAVTFVPFFVPLILALVAVPQPMRTDPLSTWIELVAGVCSPKMACWPAAKR